MENVLFLLFILSLGCFVVGAVKPSLLSRVLKRDFSRKFVIKVFGSATVLFFILFGIAGSGSTSKVSETTAPTTETKPAETNNTASTQEQAQDPTYKEAADWEKSGKKWRAVVFSSRPTNTYLIKVAKELHAKNPNDYYNFFDDDEKLQEFKDWDVNYGKVRDKDGQAKYVTDCNDMSYCIELQKNKQEAYPYPKDWADAHNIALMNEMYSDGKMKWQLTSWPNTEKISDI